MNELEAIATKTLARESHLRKKLLILKVKESVMDDSDKQKIQDAKILDGIDMKTWEVALMQLKLVLEKTDEEKCLSLPECANEKQTNRYVNIKVCCKCCCCEECHQI